jgi:hypothetical protein
MGGFLEMSAITGFDEDFFDLAVRTVNYAVEFGNTEGYVPLRIVDILKGLLELTLKMEISRKEFYSIVLEKIYLTSCTQRARMWHIHGTL